MKKKKWKKEDKEALFIPAGLFLGMGFGFLFDKFVGGLFLGLGIGFLFYAIVKNFGHKK